MKSEFVCYSTEQKYIWLSEAFFSETALAQNNWSQMTVMLILACTAKWSRISSCNGV